MCIFKWVQSDHMLSPRFTTLRKNFTYTVHINNGRIILQVNFEFLWFSDYIVIYIWASFLRLEVPMFQKSDCLTYSRWGSICLLRVAFAESFSRQWELETEVKVIWADITLLKKKKKFQGSDYDLLRMGKTMNWGRKGCVSFNQRYENSF